MNRNLTLIISAVLVVVLLAIWIYLMFFANNSDEPGVVEETGEFAQFDGLTGEEIEGGQEGGVEETSSQERDENGEIVWPILRQLTTRNVIGYQEIERASSTKVIFAESGVGHIYSIDLATGEEERVSVTTIPDAREAVFSDDGVYMVIKTGDSVGINQIAVGEINYDESTIELTPIDDQVEDFTITDDGYVVFGSVTNNSVVVKAQELGTNEAEVLFSTPFREARLLFGRESDDSHYFMPKTSYQLEGFIYKVDRSGEFNRLDIDGFGFNAINTDSYLVASYRDQSNLITEIHNLESDEIITADTPLHPQKCIEFDISVFCAIPGNKKLQYNSINQWFRGVDSYADNLWFVGDEFGELINITEFTGRNVDVIDGEVGHISSDWYFKNKIDNSLWVYELSRIYNSVETEEGLEDSEENL